MKCPSVNCAPRIARITRISTEFEGLSQEIGFLFFDRVFIGHRAFFVLSVESVRSVVCSCAIQASCILSFFIFLTGSRGPMHSRYRQLFRSLWWVPGRLYVCRFVLGRSYRK